MDDLPSDNKSGKQSVDEAPGRSIIKILLLIITSVALMSFVLFQWHGGFIAEQFVSQSFLARQYFPFIFTTIFLSCWCIWLAWKEYFGEEEKSRTVFLLMALVLCSSAGAFHYFQNSDGRFYDETFWATATLSDVELVSDEALRPGNTNGSIVMWAAAGATDPEIISALVKRGANVNEEDVHFSGTPMSAAAAKSNTPAIIDVLVKHGADVNHAVGTNDKSPLILAAELNFNAEIADRLIHHGANVDYRDKKGRSALERATAFKNSAVVTLLEQVNIRSVLAPEPD